MSVGIILADDPGTVKTGAVGTERKVFRFGFGKAFGDLESPESVAVGDGKGAFTDTHGCQTLEVGFVHVAGGVEFGTDPQSFDIDAVGAAELAVRTVGKVDGAYAPIGFAGDDSTHFSGEIEAHASEAFQKFVNAVECSSFRRLEPFGRLRLGVIGSCDDDVFAGTSDNKSVPVDLAQVGADGFGSGCSQKEGGPFARGSCHHRNFGADDLLKKVLQFVTCELDHGNAFGRNDDLALGLAL